MYEFKQTPNYNKGWVKDPHLIVIHWTGSTFQSALSWLTSKESQASAHFLIDYTGKIIQLVDLKNRAWHAGTSYCKQFGAMANNYSFGIELVGPPSKLNLPGWDNRQLKSCFEAIEFIKDNTAVAYITDHSFLSPGRKIDVRKGALKEDFFPWNDFVKKTGLMDLK